MISETRERFIRSIVERLAPERIVEAHFFPSIRQGHVETGVAVLAATPEATAGLDSPAEPAESDPPAEAAEGEPPVEADSSEQPAPVRAEVFTATYRWTRKGPDRGKWAVDVVAEAHAPIPTVGAVVRGVQERAGEALDAHRMTGDEFRATLPAPAVATAPSAAAPVGTTEVGAGSSAESPAA